jgi:hypothetical protein
LRHRRFFARCASGKGRVLVDGSLPAADYAAMIAAGETDLIDFGRAFIANSGGDVQSGWAGQVFSDGCRASIRTGFDPKPTGSIAASLMRK